MENFVVSWIHSHLSFVATWVLGISAVGVVVHKYSPKIRRFIKIGSKGLALIDALLDAVQDDKITDEEIKIIVKEVEDFKASLK